MGLIAIPEGLQTKVCVLGDNVLQEVPATIQKLWPGKTVILVADENTWKAAGKAVSEFIAAAGIPQASPIIFPAEPMLHADYQHSVDIRLLVAGKAPVVIGSGTLNDIVKLASTDAGCDGYLCVATAASVDGFTSYGAAMVVNGFKKTVPCAAPLAILADNAVVGNAPSWMAASGYADLAAKVPAGADWIIADALGEHPFDARAWSMVQDNLLDWLADAEGIKARKSEPFEKLFTGLAMTGFAMQYYHDSRPASGAEHLMSHIWEMDGLTHNGEWPSHGFKVAIGTLFTTALMQEAFAMSPMDIQKLMGGRKGPSVEDRRREIEACLGGTAFYEDGMNVAMSKLLTGEALEARRADILAKWHGMGDKVMKQLIPFDELRRRFALLGCPVEPEEIGVTRQHLYRAVVGAQMIRKRYTIFDLFYELDILKEMVDIVLEKGYFKVFA